MDMRTCLSAVGQACEEDSIDRLVVLADANKLAQVVRNLVSNALKFTPAEGEVVVMVGTGYVEGSGTMCLKVDVKDSGVGLSPVYYPIYYYVLVICSSLPL